MITPSQPRQSIATVIASLGGNSLKSTIESLNSGTLTPDEILVCIPKSFSSRVRNLTHANLKIVETDCAGQVAQRAIGFQVAKSDMVLQLDDDMIFEPETLKTLVDELVRLGSGNVLSPVFYNSQTGDCLHQLGTGVSGFFNNLIHFVFCGAKWAEQRMGSITKVGLNYGVDGKYLSSDLFKTQWLPGGCVLSYRQDLITENFFPYSGKAFSEDLIHSYLRTKRGLHHWVTGRARCFTEVEVANLTFDYSGMDKARRYYVSLSGGSLWRLNIYIFITIIKRYLTKIKNLFKLQARRSK